MSNESRIVNCSSCGGTGQQGPYNPKGREENCITCGGTGKKRMGPDDAWCGRLKQSRV